MTHDEFCNLKERIVRGVDMVLQKAEQIGREHKLYTMEELGIMSDVTKDCAESLEKLAKANYYMAEHSSQRY